MAKALKARDLDVGITFIAAEANSMGLAMMNAPSIDDALVELEQGNADAVVVLENDLYRHAPAARVDAALAKAQSLIVVDHQRTEIMNKADLVLSAASFAESDGTLVNQEGRAQRFFQVYDPAYYDDPKKTRRRLCWKAGAGCTPCTPPSKAVISTGRSWIT